MTDNVSHISKVLDETKHDLELLDKTVDNVVAKVRNNIEQRTAETTKACSNNIYEKNNPLIADMDDVFSENMGLMQGLQLSFNHKADIWNTIAHGSSRIASETTAFTMKALDQIKAKASTPINDFSINLTKDTTV